MGNEVGILGGITNVSDVGLKIHQDSGRVLVKLERYFLVFPQRICILDI